jgi:DNA-binding GntR family transcriptional regulator
MARAIPSRVRSPRDGEGRSLADQAYYAIRELIVSLELPPGSAVREPELTAELGIGRTPVREALRRLAQERLCEVRAVLEPEAARLAAERATEPDLAELGGLLAELGPRPGRDNRSLIELDQRIHRAVYHASHNPFLAETLETYYAHALRIWMLALACTDLGAAVHGHAGLLEAILRGNGERAAALMRGHVETFEGEMRDVLLAS